MIKVSSFLFPPKCFLYKKTHFLSIVKLIIKNLTMQIKHSACKITPFLVDFSDNVCYKEKQIHKKAEKPHEQRKGVLYCFLYLILNRTSCQSCLLLSGLIFRGRDRHCIFTTSPRFVIQRQASVCTP